ncbi:DNA/RNA non-specific endonuclease [Lysobacter soli]|uniref:DNA/RNA non-specific endonuclease n=1 Tax=Lysobacter soli TaxID=453783 RepID=UPI0036A91664
MATERIEKAALRRLNQPDTVAQVTNSINAVRNGVPLAAEWDQQRLEDRLAAKAQLTKTESRTIARTVARGREAIERTTARARGAREAMAPVALPRPAEVPEKIWGSTFDFIQVGFLDLGVLTARAVARVAYLDGRPQGSGFMVSNRLFLTNNHVIPTPESADALCIEFDYQTDARGNRMPVSRFQLDPNAFFLTDERDDLDYTLIAVGERLEGAFTLEAFGYCALSSSRDKHALGEFVNIVQHPDGRLKELVLRENRLVARESHVLHYIADTEPGSSGSPVFNDQWQVVALHHWGGPWRQTVGADGQPLQTDVNEGIRISVILEDLRQKGAALPHIERDLLETALSLAEIKPVPAPVASAPAASETDHREPQIDADGRATWRIPLELSVQLPNMARASMPPPPPPKPELPPSLGPEASGRPDEDYGRRSGYKPKFIRGHEIPLPALSDAMRALAAPNLQAEPGDDDFELRYHHFSVVMNGQRRLAFYTACNIDGRNAKKINRKTGDIRPMTPADVGNESMEGAEGSETWYKDARIALDQQTNQALYDAQQVAGFGTRDAGRLGRILQRGHLVRRMDPSWGDDALALKADADTFHFTNCVPQLGFFNQGNAKDLDLPNSGNGRLWRALEDHVLGNAVAEDQRVNCFTGPVLDEDDPDYRTVQVPMRFWKVVVWAEKGTLRSLAMLADQTAVLEAIHALPEGATDREAMDELDAVQDFLSTVEEIEALTGLDFGPDVRDADIRAGALDERIVARVDIPLHPAAARKLAATAKSPSKKGARKAAKKSFRKTAAAAVKTRASRASRPAKKPPAKRTAAKAARTRTPKTSRKRTQR